MYIKYFTPLPLFALIVAAEPIPLNLGLNPRSNGCQGDNCLRALEQGTATAFCQTYTTAVLTATSAIPTPIASQCDHKPSQVSSACTCLMSTSPCFLNAPSQVVDDPNFDLPAPTGGFNQGPWIIQPTRASGEFVGPAHQYDLSVTTSHSGDGDL